MSLKRLFRCTLLKCVHLTRTVGTVVTTRAVPLGRACCSTSPGPSGHAASGWGGGSQDQKMTCLAPKIRTSFFSHIPFTLFHTKYISCSTKIICYLFIRLWVWLAQVGFGVEEISSGTCCQQVWSYRPFHKTLPRSSAFANWISVRFYETDCTWREKFKVNLIQWVDSIINQF